MYFAIVVVEKYLLVNTFMLDVIICTCSVSVYGRGIMRNTVRKKLIGSILTKRNEKKGAMEIRVEVRNGK